MAKGSRNRQGQREISTLANREFDRLLTLPAFKPVYRKTAALAPRSLLSLVDDRRSFHPESAVRPTRDVFSSRPARIVLSDEVGPDRRIRNRQTKASIAFDAPERVVLCVRRKMRREVVLAKGIRAGRRRRRSFWSNVKC